MLESVSAATDPDLISYLKANPDARMRRAVRIPACYGDFMERFNFSAATQAARIELSSRAGLDPSICLLLHTSSG